jgi:hypothetical protein
LANDERSPPPQARRYVDQALASQAGSRPGQLFGMLEQADAAFRKELIAAGQANERPGIARTERSATSQRSRLARSMRSGPTAPASSGVAALRSPERSSAYTRVRSRPSSRRRFGHTHGLLVFAFNACCVVSGSAVDGRVLSEALASADDDSLAWETIEQIQAFAARGRTWRQRLWFDSVGPSVYLAGGTVEPT